MWQWAEFYGTDSVLWLECEDTVVASNLVDALKLAMDSLIECCQDNKAIGIRGFSIDPIMPDGKGFFSMLDEANAEKEKEIERVSNETTPGATSSD